jgi:hypothetical protein
MGKRRDQDSANGTVVVATWEPASVNIAGNAAILEAASIENV